MLSFSKYQGAGNDFILIDDRDQLFNPLSVSKLCKRRFGIGADGVILLQEDANADFKMRIFNCDGSEAESCGNGLRCFVQFIQDLGVGRDSIRIKIHGQIVIGHKVDDRISIEMGPLPIIKKVFLDEFDLYTLYTGVPHAVIFSSEFEKAKRIRSNPYFQPEGTNVNFVQKSSSGHFQVRTFERGVEAETLACGTGACAVAATLNKIHRISSPYLLAFPGGEIEIQIKNNIFSMIGSATLVYQGVLNNNFKFK